jgi:hypothetical protein
MLACAADDAPTLDDGAVTKQVLDTSATGPNLLKPHAWRPWRRGFERQGEAFVCDNGSDGEARRGVSQVVELNQTRPEPIVAVAWSKAKDVGGSPNSDYSLYLDLIYADDTPLWGQIAPFSVGTHGWQRREVTVLPERPVKMVAFHMLLRRHTGTAWFRDPELRVVKAPEGACLFDGVPVEVQPTPDHGFQVRDVAASSGFVRIEREAIGLKLDWKRTEHHGYKMFDLTVSDTTGKDRAITLLYAGKLGKKGWHWLHDPRTEKPTEAGREYVNASGFRVGANGRLSRYLFGAVRLVEGAGEFPPGHIGFGMGIDPRFPAFYRIGYNAATGELFLAYDLALTPEKPTAHLRFVMFLFDGKWGFRSALARYYEIFPDVFRCRTPDQGLWMPFAKISQVEGWQDFGFQFKEGTNETAWDDAHGIITFRYTEPMTWWMRMPKEMPRTMDAALAHAKQLAEKDDKRALALLTSGYHNADGQFPARLRDTPWCNGAVWSMNSMPGIPGEVTDFKNKWNPQIAEQLYGPDRKGDLDGEYVDSSEGYVTNELDFRRDHFAAAQTPLTFSPNTHRPAIFRGLIAFEYVRGIARDIRSRGKLMMANGTPIRLPWLAPLLDVMGSETNWNRSGTWRPMSDAELLYRRAMAGPKPYCFLMNTVFEEFPHERVEKYMKRCLAYGMFPGFFSHNASQGHYFSRPKLYNRDRPLFKKYVPLCKRVAEAGWRPITNARSSDPRVHVERFGDHYLTVFNDSRKRRTAALTLDGLDEPKSSRDLVTGRAITWREGTAKLTLEGEDVAVIELR